MTIVCLLVWLRFHVASSPHVDDMSKNSAMSNLEKREKRHSVHSNWYREFQKGGQIPAAGLAAGINSKYCNFIVLSPVSYEHINSYWLRK